MAARRLSSVDSPIAIPGVAGAQSVCTLAPPTTSFFLGLGIQGIIGAAIKVMGYEYLIALKRAYLDAVEAKI